MISAVNLLQRYSPHEIKHFEDRLHVQKKSSQNWFAPSPLNRLTDVITDPKRLSAARKTIGPSAQAIFRYIVVQGGCVFPDEIERHFPSSEPALRRLKDEFLVFESLFRKTKTEQVPLLVIPSELAQTLTLNEEEQRTLGIFLAYQNSAQLSCIAAALGVERAGVSSLQSAFIRRMLLDPTALRKRVSAWSVQERKLFELAVARDGFLDIQELERLGYRQILVPAGYGELTLSGAAATLYLKACLFPVPQRSPRFLLMPSDLLSLWRGPSPAAATLVASSETPEHLRSWGLRILSDLRLWSAYQSSGRVRVTQKAIPEKKAVHSFLKALDVHEYAYGLFLNHAMEAFYGVVPKGCADPLGNSPTEALGKLMVHWKKSIVWQESHEERDTRLARHVGSDSALTTRREIFMSLLKRLPDGAWVAWKDFTAAAQAAGWGKAQWKRGGFSPGYSDRYAWHDPNLRDASATLETMTTESAVWLGLLETGWQSGPNDALELSHVRLTAWGRFYLAQTAGDFPTLAGVTLEDHFTVLPNLDLTIPPRLDARTLTSLFKLAELQSPHRFVLTKSSLRDAFDEGFTPEQALGFLAEHARTGVPPSVSQWIKECAEKHGQVKVGKSGTYVEVTDPVILVELKTKRELKELLIKTIGDRVALFSEPDPDRILKLLKKLGFSPVLITSTTE